MTAHDDPARHDRENDGRNESAGNDDTTSVLRRLQAEILDETDSNPSTAETSSHERDEQWFAGLVGDTELDFTAVVSAAADEVIPVVTPRPETRAAMIETVSRALTERRKMYGLLPVLLRTVRERSNLSVAEFAQSAGMSADLIDSMESGRTPIDRVEAETVAAWIHAADAPRDQAIAALRRSLQASWTGEPLLAAGTDRRPVDIDSYVAIVERTLDSDRGARPSTEEQA